MGTNAIMIKDTYHKKMQMFPNYIYLIKNSYTSTRFIIFINGPDWSCARQK